MKNITSALILAFSLLITIGEYCYAGDFQKGLGAYDAGDYATALQEWSELAEQGNAIAQVILGVMHYEGKGVTQDYKEAVKWFSNSAEQGNAKAQFNLGVTHAKGQGVIQDNVYAHMWFNISASTGDVDAEKERDIVAKRMTSEDISKAQGLARECVKKIYKGC
jgi:TPR repeat protein